MKRLISISQRAFPALLFLLAFLPRVFQPVSRPLVWYLRSAHFVEAVLHGDWSNTVYSEHPGVGLMWPVGFTLKAFWELGDVQPAAASVPSDFEPIHFFGPVPVNEIAAGVLPLAALISLGIVGVYYLLWRLFDRPTAAVASVLFSVSPYYLAQSKVLHLDAWMATLMLLSGLTTLLYRRERRWRWLVVSGALGGLAALVKTPAVFLFPFLGLVLLADLVLSRDFSLRGLWSRLLSPLLVWVAVAVVLYVALWPVMWVEPRRGLDAVLWGVTHHADSAHDSPTFFAGQVLLDDPGLSFYGASLLLRTGEIELLFLFVALLLGLLAILRRQRSSPAAVDLALLAAFAFFFVLQMSLGAKKMPRYVIPAVLALDIPAAAGIVGWARGLARDRHRLAVALMAVPLLAQMVLVLPHHPYYGTVFNGLAGGHQMAARTILIGEEGEGLAEVADHLNSRSDAQDLVVAAQLLHVFNQTFAGTTVDIDQPAEYLVFHRNYTVRDYKAEQWGDLWERYSARTPEYEVVFSGVPYAWLYPSLSPDAVPEHLDPVTFEQQFELLGHDIRATTITPGERLSTVLYWRATQPVEQDLSIFLHLLTPTGELAWQDDGAAAHGERPTWSWAEDETVIDPHTLPDGLAEGEYVLVTGLYDWRTGTRMPAYGANGGRLDQDQVVLASITVRQPPFDPMPWVFRGAAAMVLLSVLLVIRPTRETRDEQ